MRDPTHGAGGNVGFFFMRASSGMQTHGVHDVLAPRPVEVFCTGAFFSDAFFASAFGRLPSGTGLYRAARDGAAQRLRASA